MKDEYYITEERMKIIIFSILFTVQAQYFDDGLSTLISNENSSIINDLNLVTQIVNQSRNENDKINFTEISNDLLSSPSFIINDFSLFSSAENIQDQFNINEMNFSTIIPDIISSKSESNELESTYESQTRPSLFARDYWSFASFSSTNDLDFTTPSIETIFTEEVKIEEQWFNINQSNTQDRYRSFLFWKYTNDPSWNGETYILTAEPRCLRQMCSVKLKYNGTLSTRIDGCLSFSLTTRGQPVGQLWIVEDQELDNISQKIQLINKTLHIEHSLRSKIKNLFIETRILFRNSQLDTVILSNLNVDWKGPCPKHRSVSTPFPDIIVRQSTLEDNLMTLTSEGSGHMNTFTNNNEYESSQQHLVLESTTIEFDEETTTRHSFSFVNQRNIGWFLSLIASFCFLIVLSAVGHGLWLIRRRHYFSWHVTYDSKIQFLARRSIRSSTRSENKIATISQITYDLLNSDSQQEQLNTSTTNSSQSTAMSYYTYL